ncbi:type II secretion system protein [Campylobacter gastrosuis]|uniref:Type II secretion system GspH family protein n=1 Tax=Campylobacter gastrosuis TaxID=2974576 RepID=A0ABT7HTS3_9BACT|nr:prepilin-type N-terminal cleavage/methylation domain-containing protein [Campylobacter gastrosuis]MDL0089779.1 type II secretion system GspH family protein [Campylobacter gastrosuis]
MKKAFTMVEVIFVIVILGILAAVAIPKLVATRDDAEIAKTAKNLSTIISDIGVYYTSKATLAPNLKDMTNVQVLYGVGLKENVILSSGNKGCIVISLVREGENNDEKPIHLRLSENKDGATLANGEHISGQKGDRLCEKLWKTKNIKDILSVRFNYISKDAQSGATTTKSSDSGEVRLGGSAVTW